jgi:organic hydroperoxide reductase OsmC/OhrA
LAAAASLEQERAAPWARTGGMPRPRTHRYAASVTWTGNRGDGTRTYRSYARDHVVEAGSKPPIPGTSDPAFRGDASRWSPEELLVASLSQCHMLWFLHLASDDGLVVTAYRDDPAGVMVESAGGGGRFTEVTLHPQVTLGAPGEQLDERLAHLHEQAHQMCFIASSVNFPVRCDPAAPVLEPPLPPAATPQPPDLQPQPPDLQPQPPMPEPPEPPQPPTPQSPTVEAPPR